MMQEILIKSDTPIGSTKTIATATIIYSENRYC